MMLPSVFQPSQQKRKTSSAVREADPQRPWQLIECPTENHRDDSQLSLSRHADRPRHHVLRHARLPEHIPGMDEHSCSLVSAMMQERQNARIVQILLANMISNLHAQMSRSHASAQLFASRIGVLQRNLA